MELEELTEVELREIWSDEAADFTPWLKQNIPRLSNATGLDIEITDIQSGLGDFWVDLVAVDRETGRPIIIENQLEDTNHDHLGKLITYMAGKDAAISIWIARHFREEHLQALNWLNNNTTENQLFFGVELKVYKIGESKPALHFDLVVQPNEFVKDVRKETLSDTRLSYQSFFQELLERVKSTLPQLTSANKAMPQNWFNFRSGRSRINIAVVFAGHQKFKVELYIDTPDKELNKQMFDMLMKDKIGIEKEIGTPLAWERLESKRASRIALSRDGSIEDVSKLKELQDWAVQNLDKFDKVFRQRVAGLPREAMHNESDIAGNV